MPANVENQASFEYSLPLISERLLAVTGNEGESIGLESLLDAAQMQLLAHNRKLWDAVTGSIDHTYDTEPERKAALMGALITHELLRRQAQADVMQAEFDIPFPLD